MSSIIELVSDSDEDFAEIKRKEESSSSCGGDVTAAAQSGDECPICLEQFTKEGSHRTTVTKCGHLFGFECISKAVKHSHICPLCRVFLKKKDLICVFGSRVMAVDNTKIDELTAQLAHEKAVREKVRYVK